MSYLDAPLTRVKCAQISKPILWSSTCDLKAVNGSEIQMLTRTDISTNLSSNIRDALKILRKLGSMLFEAKFEWSKICCFSTGVLNVAVQAPIQELAEITIKDPII